MADVQLRQVISSLESFEAVTTNSALKYLEPFEAFLGILFVSLSHSRLRAEAGASIGQGQRLVIFLWPLKLCSTPLNGKGL